MRLSIAGALHQEIAESSWTSQSGMTTNGVFRPTQFFRGEPVDLVSDNSVMVDGFAFKMGSRGI